MRSYRGAIFVLFSFFHTVTRCTAQILPPLNFHAWHRSRQVRFAASRLSCGDGSSVERLLFVRRNRVRLPPRATPSLRQRTAPLAWGFGRNGRKGWLSPAWELCKSSVRCVISKEISYPRLLPLPPRSTECSST